MKTPLNFECWNKALQGAYTKGYRHGNSGQGREDCPYKDTRKQDGRLTWSRAFRSAWMDGWEAGKSDWQDYLINEYYTDRNNSGLSPLSK